MRKTKTDRPLSNAEPINAPTLPTSQPPDCLTHVSTPNVLAEANAVNDDPDQVWFWSEQWQAMEREADADMAAGRVKQFASGDELVAYLRTIRDDLSAR